MSLGWLTESAVLPKKSMPIQVNSTSLLSIQTTISEETGKLSAEPKGPCLKPLRQILGRKPPEKDNPPPVEQEKDPAAALEAKSRIYEELRKSQKAPRDKYLVDFERQSDSSDDEPGKRRCFEEPKRGVKYGRLLTKEEKQQLPAVLSETRQMSEEMNLVRRRRQEIREERIRRIQALKSSGRLSDLMQNTK